ncbi:hypothetical protein D3C83_259850 [compost metagenome]
MPTSLAKRDIAGVDGVQFAARKPKHERAVAVEAVEPALDQRPFIAVNIEHGPDRMGPGKPRLRKQ